MHSIVLCAAGNTQIGVGHLSRTATLASALLKTQGWNRVVLLWETSSDLAAYFAPQGCEVIPLDNQPSAQALAQLAATEDDWTLITDLLNLQPQDMLLFRAQGFHRLGHINDSGSGRALVDLLVDEDAFKTAADLPAGFQGTGLVGNAYRIIRTAVVQKRPRFCWAGERVKRLLISLGGADPGNLTLQLLASVCPQLPQISITAVIGPAFDSTHKQALQQFAQQQDNLQVLESPELATLLAQHDLIVTLGGLTTYEAICLGKPCAALAWGHMTPYVEALHQMGLLENLGTIQQAAADLLSLVQAPDRLKTLAQTGWQAIDGLGADRVASVAIELATSSIPLRSSTL